MLLPCIPKGPNKLLSSPNRCNKSNGSLIIVWWQKPMLNYNSASHQLLDETVGIRLLFLFIFCAHPRKHSWFKSACPLVSSRFQSMQCLPLIVPAYNHTHRGRTFPYKWCTFMRLNPDVLDKLLPSLLVSAITATLPRSFYERTVAFTALC